MAYRPAKVYTGSGWDDIGDPRIGAENGDIPQASVEDLTSDLASKVDYATPTNAQAGTAYTFVADDAERLTTASNGSAVTFTIPPQSSVAWGDDTILRVVNYGAGALTVAGGSGVTVTNTATTIGQFGGGAAIRTGSDAWTFVPFGAGKEPITATGGNEVETVGSYRYHLFTSSSSFVLTSPATAEIEIAVVGAGGGGGYTDGGGGGGGAIEPASGFSTQTLTAGSYTVTIASGGAGSTANNTTGGTPSASSFAGTSTISANGGGGGGSYSVALAGASGGSGGGGAINGGAGGSASGNNTNAGGSGQTGVTAPFQGGGGGGATAAGTSGNSTGNGGEGLTLTSLDSNLTSGNFTTFSGMTVISSGGGGGHEGAGTGTAGTGGGDGGSNAAGDNATSFGSGGGGRGAAGAGGGNGYGGLVIVRYAV